MWHDFTCISVEPLSGANFVETNLSAVDSRQANLSRSILLGTDLRDVEDLKPEQLNPVDSKKDPPYLCHVALPINLKNAGISPDRDCEDIPGLLVERSYSKSVEEAKNLVNKIRNPEAKVKEQEDLSGYYIVNGQNPDGRKYSGQANIIYENGIYNINWTIAGKQKLAGSGKLLKSGLLKIKWNGKNPDVVIYSMKYEDDKLDKLVGVWSNYLGIETFTPIIDFRD